MLRPSRRSARPAWFPRMALLLGVGPLLLIACSAAPAASPKATDAVVASLPAAPASPSPTGAFHLVKSCTGYSCTVTASSYSGIPVGAKVHYTGDNTALAAVITVSGGTATGVCNIASLPGKCSFTAGTGTLAAFREELVVTQDADGLWYWDGPLAP